MAKLYVAYGSNLNMVQMHCRCPTAEFVGTGVIQDYALQFKGSLHNAHATIVPKAGSSVPVGIWTIGKTDERRLDIYEGYPGYYFKQDIPNLMKRLEAIWEAIYRLQSSSGNRQDGQTWQRSCGNAGRK